MAKLKDVKIKIGAVKKTKQITKAMNMVAASKLRGAQSKMEGFRPYAEKFDEVLQSLSAKVENKAINPLLASKEKVKNINVILCTSDRGLCGGFNTNLVTKAERFFREKNGQNISVSFTAFGKKGRDWCQKKRFEIAEEYLGIMGANFDFSIAALCGKKIITDFLNNKYDEVYVIYGQFISMAKQVPLISKILPISTQDIQDTSMAKANDIKEKDKPFLAEHICEPSPYEVLSEMLPRSVYVKIYKALLETSTSEHAARMTAMNNATKACNDMINTLTLVYNKARQAAITAELMDIVGGAEALKG